MQLSSFFLFGQSEYLNKITILKNCVMRVKSELEKERESFSCAKFYKSDLMLQYSFSPSVYIQRKTQNLLCFSGNFN